MVVGSDDGKVRLYSSATLTQAKTSIPGLGASVTAVDVSYDAEWVLATTDRYLMVVKTRFTDKAGRWAAHPRADAPCLAPPGSTGGVTSHSVMHNHRRHLSPKSALATSNDRHLDDTIRSQGRQA